MILQALFFYVFSFITVGAAFMVIVSRNPVHSVLFLILAFFNAAGLFILLGAEFLAMILVVVYVGAVAVLFLFVVMMLDVDFAALRQGLLQYLPVGALVGLVLLVELIPRGVPDAGARADVQHRGDRRPALHALYLLLPDGRPDPACGDDRSHRPHLAAPRRREAPERRAAGRPHARDGRRRRPRGDGEGHSLTVGLGHYLTVAAILFTLGVFGIFLNRKNVIIILMSVELILLAVNLNLVAFSAYLNDLTGQIFALLVLTVAAAEAAIGLAILVVFYRNRGSIAVEDINLMKG
jgi:NADH:ubiquinone oxidoreductase subunit 6 (subunit J)/NADH:ubiquinone oxidoreductase subunit K